MKKLQLKIKVKNTVRFRKTPLEDNTQNYIQNWKITNNNILKIIFRIILSCARKLYK